MNSDDHSDNNEQMEVDELKRPPTYAPTDIVPMISDLQNMEQDDQDEDPWLERIAIKGKGWKRIKLIFIITGICVSIGVRFVLVSK